MARREAKKDGFTIIEVVLVLAIAGLIFLMVFVALPALQRSQRDTQRRNDMSRVDTSLVQYQTNNSSAKNNLPVGPSYWAACADGSFDDSCETSSAYQSYNPSVARAFVQRYMNSGSDSAVNTFEDPDGTYYNVVITTNLADTATGVIMSFLSDNMNLPQRLTLGCLLQTAGASCVAGNEISYEEHTIYIIPGGQCSGELVAKSTKRHFAIFYRLEGAGVYCIDDQ